LKFEVAPQFKSDLRKLSAGEYGLFRKVAKDEFSPACDRYLKDPSRGWPSKLRVKHVVGTAAIFEMTWSFKGPDGRATFQWVTVASERRVLWRRIGGHEIFKKP